MGLQWRTSESSGREKFKLDVPFSWVLQVCIQLISFQFLVFRMMGEIISFILKCRLKLDLEIVFFFKRFLNCNVTLVFETDVLLLFF